PLLVARALMPPRPNPLPSKAGPGGGAPGARGKKTAAFCGGPPLTLTAFPASKRRPPPKRRRPAVEEKAAKVPKAKGGGTVIHDLNRQAQPQRRLFRSSPRKREPRAWP